jgi:hypothetical protein
MINVAEPILHVCLLPPEGLPPCLELRRFHVLDEAAYPALLMVGSRARPEPTSYSHGTKP